MPPTRTKAPSSGNKQTSIPSNSHAHPDQRVEPDYFTKGGTIKPSPSKSDENPSDIPNVPADSRDTKHQKADRREFDRFVGNNDLKSRADPGKVGVQQV